MVPSITLHLVQFIIQTNLLFGRAVNRMPEQQADLPS
jgi:hypothetical protein